MSQNQKLRASITIGSVLEGSVSKNIGILKSGLYQVGDAIKGVERRQRELSKQRNVLLKQGQSVEALDREYADLERTLARLRRSQERWNRAAAASRRLGSAFSDTVGSLRRDATRLTIGATAAAGAVFGIASSTAALGDGVAKTADKLGIGIGALQELRYAAERSGVATSTFDTALGRMAKNIGEALEGTGAAADALGALGLRAEDLAQMKPDEQLGLIADRMDGVATNAEKAAIANDLFGRSGIDLINMLRGGSRGLRTLREDARKTGYVLSERAARDAEVFQDTLLDTQLTMKGLKNTVGSALLPVVTRAMGRIGDALVSNRAEVEVWAESFASSVETAIPVIGDLAEGIGSVTGSIGGMLGQIAGLVGGWENVGKAIGAAFAAKYALKIGRMAWALGALVVAGGPVVWIIGAIGTAVALVVTHFEDLKRIGGAALKWIGDRAEWVADKIRPLIDGLRRIGDLGTIGAGSAGRAERRRSSSTSGETYQRPTGSSGRGRALGGAFSPGWLLTGEMGPELQYANRAGYIAHNRALRQMAGYADKAARLLSPGQRAEAAAPVTINQDIRIDAAGASAEEVARVLERRSRLASQAALYDRTARSGPYGR